ncbi:MAG: PmbA protein [Thermotogaceae bacterium]|nr:PmbA protein [Thermotogaceae bacterium]
MNFEEFKDKVLAYAKKKGLEAELNYEMEYEFSIMLSNGELDQYSDAGSRSVMLKVLKNGKLGVSSTEIFEEPERLVEEAEENMKLVDSEEEELLYDGKGDYPSYPSMKTYFGEFEKLSVKDKMDFAFNIHKHAKEDKRIIMVPRAVFAHFVRESRIINTLGLELFYKGDGGYAYAMTLAADNSPRAGLYFDVSTVPEGLNSELIGKKAAEEAIMKIGSKSLKSGKYRVILRNDVVSEIFGMLAGMVSAERAQKNLTPLKNKLGEKVGSDILNILDLPYFPGSIFNRPFDSEGVPTQEKKVFENGVFKTFLHNLKTAKKENRKSTGNARGLSEIAPVNFVIEKGNYDYNQLIKELDSGIVITDVEGMHSGSNPISGNFSLGARGYRVENGEIVGGVEQITISGNILEILKNVEAVGSDIKVFLSCISPSLLIKEIDVAGNEK